jgi:hypothetical protein
MDSVTVEQGSNDLAKKVDDLDFRKASIFFNVME